MTVLARLFFAVLLCFATSTDAVAGNKDGAADAVPEAPPVQQAQVKMAEYRRQQHKIQSLATKNAWEGVERAYQDLMATGVMPEYDDYIWGAKAAQALGDVTESRGRVCYIILETVLVFIVIVYAMFVLIMHTTVLANRIGKSFLTLDPRSSVDVLAIYHVDTWSKCY